MEISARSFFTTGMSLTAAVAIAFAPLPILTHQPTVTIPTATVPAVRLAAAQHDIAAAMAGLQMFFDDASVTAAGIVGLPGRGLIGVAGDIETFFDVALTRLIDAAGDPTTTASLMILRTLAVDAWAKLEENLGLINPALMSATEQVGKLLTSAGTGSLQNILIAVARVIADPLSLPNYGGLASAGLTSTQLVLGNALRAIQTVGDAGFDVAGIAVRELTFQFTNLIGGASALLTQLGDASGVPIVDAVLGAVRDLMLAPVRAVIDFNSGLIQAGLTTANAAFDVVLDGATEIVDPQQQQPAAVPDQEVASVQIDSDSTDHIVQNVLDRRSDDAFAEQAVDDEPAVEEGLVQDDTAAEEEPVEQEELAAEDHADEKAVADELTADDSSDDEASPGEAPAADGPRGSDSRAESTTRQKADAASGGDSAAA
jgi:hypothetical protein